MALLCVDHYNMFELSTTFSARCIIGSGITRRSILVDRREITFDRSLMSFF